MSVFAKIKDVKAGDVLIADGGFTCIKKGASLLVYVDASNRDLYVSCEEGRHYLNGQASKDGLEYVGLYPEKGL